MRRTDSSQHHQIAWPAGDGMAATVRAYDWSRTPLGAIASWPQSLKTAADLVLACQVPMIVLWGPELIQIYNDAYRDVMDCRRPDGLGQPARERRPISERVRNGESITLMDQLLPVSRQGRLEDAWFTLSYSPIRDENAAVAGVLVTVFETTERVLAVRRRLESEQRRSFLLDLSQAVASMQEAEEIQQALGELLGEHLRCDRCDFLESGRHAYQGYPTVSERLQNGRAWAIPDIPHSAELPADERRRLAEENIAAWILAPLVKAGRLAAVLSVTQAEPRERTPAEVALVEETAQRAWVATGGARATSAFRESEEQFRRAVEEAPIPMIMHAEDGQVLQISKTWTELTGYRQEDLPTFEAWLNTAYGEGADRVRQHMRDLFQGAWRWTSPTAGVSKKPCRRAAESWRANSPTPESCNGSAVCWWTGRTPRESPNRLSARRWRSCAPISPAFRCSMRSDANCACSPGETFIRTRSASGRGSRSKAARPAVRRSATVNGS